MLSMRNKHSRRSIAWVNSKYGRTCWCLRFIGLVRGNYDSWGTG